MPGGLARRGRPMTRASLAVILGVPDRHSGRRRSVHVRLREGLPPYLSPDPKACVNCHIMNPQYDAWLKSGHRHAATCVECHLPHEGLAKWAAKAEHGFRHSVAFTLQNFKEPIEITPRTASSSA